MIGRVKKLVNDKGFGFIKADDGKEYFFHRSAVLEDAFDSMKADMAVEFETGQGPKGPRAEKVKILTEEQPA